MTKERAKRNQRKALKKRARLTLNKKLTNIGKMYKTAVLKQRMEELEEKYRLLREEQEKKEKTVVEVDPVLASTPLATQVIANAGADEVVETPSEQPAE